VFEGFRFWGLGIDCEVLAPPPLPVPGGLGGRVQVENKNGMEVKVMQCEFLGRESEIFS